MTSAGRGGSGARGRGGRRGRNYETSRKLRFVELIFNLAVLGFPVFS